MTLHNRYDGLVNSPYGDVNATVLVYSRNGSMSPSAIYIRYKHRIISPYEQRVRGWKITVCLGMQMLKSKYSAPLKDLFYDDNMLFRETI